MSVKLNLPCLLRPKNKLTVILKSIYIERDSVKQTKSNIWEFKLTKDWLGNNRLLLWHLINKAKAMISRLSLALEKKEKSSLLCSLFVNYVYYLLVFSCFDAKH